MSGRRVLAGGAVVLVLALMGCGADAGGGGGSGDSSVDWEASTERVDGTGLVYAVDDVVHLGDGSTIDLRTEPAGFVLAGDGVYFVPVGDDADGDLRLATADGVDSTGARADASSLRTSPDGRFLAFIDDRTGAEDRFGTPVATAVVVDLAAGEEVLRSTDGMGDPEGDDDLADLYEDADGPAVLGVTGDTAYVDTPDGARAYDLADGQGREVPESQMPWVEDEQEDLVSPAGTWRIDNPLDGPPLLRPVAGGRAVVTSADGVESWAVTGWLDDETVVASGDPVGERWAPLTCRLPSGRCTRVPGTEGGALRSEDGLRLPGSSPAS